MTQSLDHIMTAALRAGDKLLIEQVLRKRVVAGILSLRDRNPELEKAVAQEMMKHQTGRVWNTASTSLRAVWCQEARHVIDALVDAILRE